MTNRIVYAAGSTLSRWALQEPTTRARHPSYAAAAATVLALALVFLVSMPAAQNQMPANAAADKPTPRMPDGHPNFNGFYGSPPGQGNPGEQILTKAADGSYVFLYGGAEEGAAITREPTARPNAAPYKPEYMARVKEIEATVYGNATPLDPQADCKPFGVPRGAFAMMQIVQNEQYIALLYEDDPGFTYRVIYLDGRQHPKDLDTSYLGHSIGHWDGDTLVVDVVGLNDETWLGGGADGSTIHSDKEHVIEHWTRKGDEITYQATVEDPVMFTRPWETTPRRIRIAKEGDYIQPSMCLPNAKTHLIRPSETDKFACNWCQKDPDAVYGPGASADRAKNQPAPGARGGE